MTVKIPFRWLTFFASSIILFTSGFAYPGTAGAPACRELYSTAPETPQESVSSVKNLKNKSNQQLVDEVLSSVGRGQDVYAQEALYAFVARDKSLATRLAKLYGNETASELVTKIKSQLGAKFLPVLIDPGLAQRLDDYIAFVKKNGLKSQSPYETRMAFADSLGDVTFYRGLKLTDEDFEQALRNGIGPQKFARTIANGDYSALGKYYESNLLGTFSQASNYNDEIAATRSPEPNKMTALLPITSYPEVAEGVAASTMGLPFFNGKATAVRLFKIKVPTIRVLSTKSIFKHRWDDTHTEGAMRFWDASTGLMLRSVDMTETALESYIDGFILPGWIEKDTTTITTPGAMWEDGNENYRVYNWNKVDLSKKTATDPADSGIPYSTDDFYSILRNDPGTILDQTKLGSFLKTKAGPNFKLELLHIFGTHAYANELTPFEAKPMMSKIFNFKQLIEAQPGFAQNFFDLETDANAEVSTKAIQAARFSHFSSDRQKLLVQELLKDGARDPKVRLESAFLLVFDKFSGTIAEITGLDSDALFGIFKKICVGNEPACARILQQLYKLEPTAFQSSNYRALYSSLLKRTDGDNDDDVSHLPNGNAPR